MTKSISKGNSQISEAIINELKGILSAYGPKGSFSQTESTRQFNFRDNIYFDFDSSWAARHKLVKLIKEYYSSDSINDASLYRITFSILDLIIDKILEEYPDTTKRLIEYFQSEYVSQVINFLEAEAKKLGNLYTGIIITDFISLSGVEEIQIGRCKISKINESLLPLLPAELPAKSARNEALLAMSGLRNYDTCYSKITKLEFVERFKDKVAIICPNLSGYHFKDEQSLVVDEMTKQLKLTYSFLKYSAYLINREEDIKVCDAQNSSDKFPYFETYISADNDNNFFEVIKSKADIAFITDQILITDKIRELLDDLCLQSNFNTACEAKTDNKIAIETNSKVETAFDWYLRGLVSRDMTDKFLSFFICLEVLLSHSKTEVSDNMAENAAILFASDFNIRYAKKKRFKELYNVRCEIVHAGRKLSSSTEDFGVVYDTESFITIIICKVLYLLPTIYEIGLKDYLEKIKLRGVI